MYINVDSDILNDLLNSKKVDGYFLREKITSGSNVVLIFEHDKKTWRALGTLFLEKKDEEVIGIFNKRCRQVKKTPVMSYVWEESA